MLLEVYLAVLLTTFVFCFLSFIPVGARVRKWSRGSGGDEETETQSYVVIFAWLAMSMFFILSVASMDVQVVRCETVIDSINTSVTNLQVYSSSWTCTEYQYVDMSVAYLFSGFGTFMLVYAIITTFLFSAVTITKAMQTASERK